MAKTNTEISYEVKAEIGDLNDKGLKVRTVAWNGKEAKIDIRSWYEDKDGNEKANKGVTLTNEEAKKLVDLLSQYLSEDDEEDF